MPSGTHSWAVSAAAAAAAAARRSRSAAELMKFATPRSGWLARYDGTARQDGILGNNSNKLISDLLPLGPIFYSASLQQAIGAGLHASKPTRAFTMQKRQAI